MKKLLFLLSLLLPLIAPAITLDEVPNVHVADRNRYVSNPSGVLSPAAVSTLDNYIKSLWTDTSVELVVVAVDEVDPDYTPDEFATKLFEKWKIGKADKDNGLLVLVSTDDRAAIIRTGYGVEGAVPDIVAGRIIRDFMLPKFREGDYDGGITAGVSRLGEIVRDPSLGDELKSDRPNDAIQINTLDSDTLFQAVLGLAVLVAALVFVFSVIILFSTRKLDDVDRWRSLRKYRLALAIIACLTLGMGLPAFLILWWKMRNIRHRKHKCPHCGSGMKLIDEEHDNDYLTPAQDMEERLNSVDYDVWHCPKCHQTDIFPFVNDSSSYKECPKCHARTLGVTERRILRQATAQYEGQGMDRLVCRNCGHHDDRYFKIPRKESDAAAAAALGAILGSAGRGGGGGSFGGGSFGGGMTGGGGASGNW